jgi:hypothetical protein
MADFLRELMYVPALDRWMALPGVWAICETLHFIGLCLLLGLVGLFDLRVLGIGKGVAPVSLKRLVPWGVFGFILCAVSGGLFVFGMGANIIGGYAYDVIATNPWLQYKLIFLALAGLNLGAFYVSGMSRAVDALDANGSAPPLARVFAGASIFLWVGVIVFGRLIPQGL